MKKISVSIGIPMYNEEKNIRSLLNSLQTQKEEGFFIKEIIAVLDGCTDKTFDKIKQIHDKKIKVINHNDRKGKSARLNEIFNIFKGDYLVLLDADVVMDGKSALKNMIEVLQKNNKTGLVSGRAKPAKPATFLEKSINTSLNVYYRFLETVNDGNNIFACKGAFLGLSKKFAKSLKIPQEVFANDAYMYFCNKTKGYLFGYAKNAVVLIHSPKTIKDQISQNKRYVGAETEMEKYFGNLVSKEFSANTKILYKLMFEEFLKNPLECIYVFAVNLYTKIYVRLGLSKINAVWSLSQTTKEGIM